MQASRRTEPNHAFVSNRNSRAPNAALAAALAALDASWREVVREFRRAARRAAKKQHPVEHAILYHIASRLKSPIASPDEWERTCKEAAELCAWLPTPVRIRNQDVLERKVDLKRFVHRQKLDQQTTELLVAIGTRSPGRPARTAGAAVRAMELHAKGRSWAQIEKKLVPHRRSVVNSGRSINREVQLLRATLKRCGVAVPDL